MFIIRAIVRFFYWLAGWKINGAPPKIPKYVICIGPHTSNYDFPVAASVKLILRVKMKYAGKASLFKRPYGWFFRALGGIPVDRSSRNNFVKSIVKHFNSGKDYAITFAAEGTRKYTPDWKSGFYHVALEAKTPIVLVGMCYRRKEVIFSDVYHPTGNKEIDFSFMKSWFKDVQAKYPKKTFLN